MAFLLKDASPAAFAFSLADAYSAGHAAKYLVALVILIVVLAVLSWIAYEKDLLRQQEDPWYTDG